MTVCGIYGNYKNIKNIYFISDYRPTYADIDDTHSVIAKILATSDYIASEQRKVGTKSYRHGI